MKVGDKFTWNNHIKFPYREAFSGSITCVEILTGSHISCPIRGTCDLTGTVGAFKQSEITLIEDNSDQALAERFQQLRKESLVVAHELTKRGFAAEYESSIGWVPITMSFNAPIRFVKTETVKTIL